MADSTLQKVREWTRVATQILGVDAELSDDGICTLLIGNDLVIAIEVPEEGDWFYLYSPLGELPKENMEEALYLCQKALELNAFQGASRGGAIGLIPGQTILVYSLMKGCEGCDEQIFAETIALFYEAALDLRGTLELAPYIA